MDLNAELNRILREHVDDIDSNLEEIAQEIGKKTVERLKVSSPKKSGKYAKGWKMTIVNKAGRAQEVTIHNKVYQLTHLLENGHALKNGGRTRAFKHIEPAEEQAIQEFIEAVTP